jgi:hypothetical protein
MSHGKPPMPGSVPPSAGRKRCGYRRSTCRAYLFRTRSNDHSLELSCAEFYPRMPCGDRKCPYHASRGVDDERMPLWRGKSEFLGHPRRGEQGRPCIVTTMSGSSGTQVWRAGGPEDRTPEGSGQPPRARRTGGDVARGLWTALGIKGENGSGRQEKGAPLGRAPRCYSWVRSAMRERLGMTRADALWRGRETPQARMANPAATA